MVAGSSRETEPIAAARGIRFESSPSSAIVDGDERRLARAGAQSARERDSSRSRERHDCFAPKRPRSARSSSRTTATAFRPANASAFSNASIAGRTTAPGRAWALRSCAGSRARTTERSPSMKARSGGARFVAAIPAHDRQRVIAQARRVSQDACPFVAAGVHRRAARARANCTSSRRASIRGSRSARSPIASSKPAARLCSLRASRARAFRF